MPQTEWFGAFFCRPSIQFFSAALRKTTQDDIKRATKLRKEKGAFRRQDKNSDSERIVGLKPNGIDFYLYKAPNSIAPDFSLGN